jgi:hypothetical protein
MQIVRAKGSGLSRDELRQEKTADPSVLCPGQRVCWGDDGTPQELDYTCCDVSDTCMVQDNGDPGCELNKAKVFVGRLQLHPRGGVNLAREIGQYIQ